MCPEAACVSGASLGSVLYAGSACPEPRAMINVSCKYVRVDIQGSRRQTSLYVPTSKVLGHEVENASNKLLLLPENASYKLLLLPEPHCVSKNASDVTASATLHLLVINANLLLLDVHMSMQPKSEGA